MCYMTDIKFIINGSACKFLNFFYNLVENLDNQK